jgi:hypothetical protein
MVFPSSAPIDEKYSSLATAPFPLQKKVHRFSFPAAGKHRALGHAQFVAAGRFEFEARNGYGNG